jgi:hypothetical protein
MSLVKKTTARKANFSLIVQKISIILGKKLWFSEKHHF